MVLVTFSARLLQNLLTNKSVYAGDRVIQAGNGAIAASRGATPISGRCGEQLASRVEGSF